MIELTLNEATPSLNKMIRLHWTVDRKLKAKWVKMVWVALRSQRMGPVQPFSRARVTITRISPRMLDRDNLFSSVKHPLDGLKICSVIVDDSPEHIELIVRQEKGKAGTRIQIEPLCAA